MGVPLTDIGARLKASIAGSGGQNSGAPVLIVAAGGYDNIKITGNTIDRWGYDSLKLIIAWRFALTEAKTVSFAIEYAESADASTWDTAVELESSTVRDTGGTGGTNETNVHYYNHNLRSLKRYVRYNITCDLSHTSTDTGYYTAVAILGGTHVLPAA